MKKKDLKPKKNVLRKLSSNELIKLGVSKDLAAKLHKNGPFKNIKEILNNDEIIKSANWSEIRKVIEWYAEVLPKDLTKYYPTFPTSAISDNCMNPKFENEIYINSEGVIYGITTLYCKDNLAGMYLYIKNSLNIELVSGLAFKSNKVWKLSYSSITILTHTSFELKSLDQQSGHTGSAILHSKGAIDAGLLWKHDLDSKLSSDKQQMIRELSEILNQLQQFTRPRKKLLGKPCKGEPNGCTAVPDFNFEDCCNAHDICYDTGGNEADRLTCDIKLHDCIQNHGHPILADLYYYGVRSFGTSHFNYQMGETTPSDPVTPPSSTTGPKCILTVYLISVAYNGEDIGNDWVYKIKIQDGEWVRIPAGDGYHRLDNGSLDTSIVKEKVFKIMKKCGDEINLTFFVEASEIDPFYDDHGNSSKTFSFTCNGGTSMVSLDVAVIDDTAINETAQLTFTFQIETMCEE